MLLKYIEKTQKGLKSWNKNILSLPVCSNLLESLRCHRTDEYPVLSAEDESPVPPLACSFSKSKNTEHILAVVDESGCIVLYNTNLAGDDAIVADWNGHNNALFDLEWLKGEQKLLTASGDQSICLWDVPSKKKLLTFKGHCSSVRSVKCRPHDDAVFASGGRDGQVRVWDTRCNVKGDKVSSVGVIKKAHCVSQPTTSRKKKALQAAGVSQDCQQSVTCVLFQNEHLLTTSGAVDGCVKVWDIRKIKPDNSLAVYSFPYTGTSKRTHGYSSLTFDNYFSRLYANCTDDVIYCYDFISYKPEPVCTYKGHRNTSFYIKSVLSPDNEFLLSGSADEQAYIWQVSKPNASPVILKGHRSEISDVAWCKKDLFRIVTTSDDNTIRVWRYDPTAEERKKLGRTDAVCDIIGAAERTHRDIGTSVEPGPRTPKGPSHSSLKRSASSPFGPVTTASPKQSKSSISSSPSPSIKMWLKRSATAPEVASLSTGTQLGASGEPGNSNKEKNVNQSDKLGGEHKKSGVNQSNEETCSVAKKIKMEAEEVKGNNSSEICTEKIENKGTEDVKYGANKETGSVRRSCKRKLVEDSPSPKKSKKQRLSGDVVTDGCRVIDDEDKENRLSPRKNRTEIRTLDKEISLSPIRNRTESKTIEKENSPVKNRPGMKLDLCKSPSIVKENNMEIFQSPSRISLREQDPNIYHSPTANLPNSVIDGHQKIVCKLDNVDSKKKSVDWLTEMRIRKLAKQSPKTKKCRSKLVDKMTDSAAAESSQDDEKSVPSQSSRPKSPGVGLRSIASFLSPPKS